MVNRIYVEVQKMVDKYIATKLEYIIRAKMTKEINKELEVKVNKQSSQYYIFFKTATNKLQREKIHR